MEHFESHPNNVYLASAFGTQLDDRLRLITLARGDVWPERQSCELALVLSCKSGGFTIAGLDGRLCAGQLMLLPLGNELIASAHGQVLTARIENLKAPTVPQRLGDRLIGLLLRRAWASYSSGADIVGPTLRLIEVLAASKVRQHQEHIDFLESLDPRIAAVLEYVETHYCDALNVAQLADIACLSSGHFSRAFKAAMGEPVWTYVQRRRCERAKQMLEMTGDPIAQIAYACGFAHQGHLTNCLKAQFGLTPRAIRSAS